MNFADNYYKKNIIAKLVGKTDLLTAYCVSTNMPLVECNEASFNDQVYAFDTEEDLKSFVKPYFDKKLPLKGIRFPAKDKMRFFSTLLCISVDEIVFVDKNGKHVISLSDFLKKKDFSQLPLQKRPIENPQLQLSGLYFAQEASRGVPAEEKENLKELEEELAANMAKGIYILPVDFLPAQSAADPDKAESKAAEGSGPEGTSSPDTQKPNGQQIPFRIPLIKDPKGDMVVPLFSDHMEYQKYDRDHKLKALAVPFANLESMLAKEAKGYMLNPNGFHLNMPRELLKGLKVRFPNVVPNQPVPPNVTLGAVPSAGPIDVPPAAASQTGQDN